MPAYNTKRRLPATIVRRRSMSQNSIYSSTSEYRTPTPYVMSQQVGLFKNHLFFSGLKNFFIVLFLITNN